MKFEPFLNLPPRSLKEYFSIIAQPLSLKALQKLVKGIHGRQSATGISDFKTWAAFEEKASLLWNNAHYFNEEGSPIYNLATELEVHHDQIPFINTRFRLTYYPSGPSKLRSVWQKQLFLNLHPKR